MWQVRGKDRYFWFCYQTQKQPPRNVECFCWFSHDCTLNFWDKEMFATIIKIFFHKILRTFYWTRCKSISVSKHLLNFCPNFVCFININSRHSPHMLSFNILVGWENSRQFSSYSSWKQVRDEKYENYQKGGISE